jgi:hypothetical protein
LKRPTADAVLVRTERSHAPPKRASFANPYDPLDPTGDGYAANARGIPTFAERHEKKAVVRKRFLPPGDGRFFDGGY